MYKSLSPGAINQAIGQCADLAATALLEIPVHELVCHHQPLVTDYSWCTVTKHVGAPVVAVVLVVQLQAKAVGYHREWRRWGDLEGGNVSDSLEELQLVLESGNLGGVVAVE